MAQWLRTHTILTEGTCVQFLIPTRQLTAITPLPGDPVPSSGLYTQCVYMNIYVCVYNIYVYMHIFLIFF